MTALMKCTACGRAGDDIGTCGSFVTCPNTGVPVGPTDVVIHCDLCDITRVVSVASIVQGKAMTAAHSCPVSTCEGRAVTIKAPRIAAKAAPKPAEEPKAADVSEAQDAPSGE